MRLIKDIEHVMETMFMIREEEARKLLPNVFTPYTFFGKGLIQLGSLKYRDLKFEGQSLGPCTDVYIALATIWKGKLNGFCISFYNDNEEIVKVVNKNWFFGKKLAKISWELGENNYSVHVIHDGKRILDYGTSIPTGLIILPVLQRTRRALTLYEEQVYTFDNIFDKRFGVYARPQIQAQKSLEWFAYLQKKRLYSIMWFNDTLSVTDAQLSTEGNGQI